MRNQSSFENVIRGIGFQPVRQFLSGLLPAILACSMLIAMTDAVRAEDVLIRAGRVITVSGATLKPGTVLVSDGRIAGVATSIEAPEGARVIEMPDGVLMPGLIDAFNNRGLSGGTSEYARELTPRFSVADALDLEATAWRRAIGEGITTTCVAPGSENVIAGRAALVRSSDSVRPRILSEDAALVITVAEDPKNRNTARRRPDSIFNRQPTNRMGVVWLLRSSLDAARRGEGSPVVAEVLAGKRRVLAVSRTHHDIRALLEISREFNFSPIIVGGQEMFRLAPALTNRKDKHHLSVILAPLTTGAITGKESTVLARNQAGLLHKAGIPFALSGDRLLEQARFAVRFGLPEQAALQAITLTPATILGVNGTIGAIATGMDADLIALSGNPLEFTTTIRWVMIGGRIIEQGN